MTYLLTGLTVFVAVLAARAVERAAATLWARWHPEPDESTETLSPAIGFVMSREWSDDE